MRYQDVRRIVLILCPNAYGYHQREHDLPPIRYLVLLGVGESGWVDEPTWKQYRHLSMSMPWAEARIEFAECEICKMRSSS